MNPTVTHPSYFPTTVFEPTALDVHVDWSILRLTIDYDSLARHAVEGVWRNDIGQLRDVEPPITLHHFARDSIRWSTAQFRTMPHYFLVERRFGLVDHGLLEDVYIGLRFDYETPESLHFEAFDQFVVSRSIDTEGLNHLLVPNIIRPHPLDYSRRVAMANNEVDRIYPVWREPTLRRFLPHTWNNFGVPNTWEEWNDTIPMESLTHPLYYLNPAGCSDLEGIHPNTLTMLGDILTDDFGTLRDTTTTGPDTPSSDSGSLPALAPPTPVITRHGIIRLVPRAQGSPSALSADNDRTRYEYSDADGEYRRVITAPVRNNTPTINPQPNSALWYQPETGAWTYDIRRAFPDDIWGAEIWAQFEASLGPRPTWEAVRRPITPDYSGYIRSSVTPPPTLFPRRRPLRTDTPAMSPPRSPPHASRFPVSALRGPGSPDLALVARREASLTSLTAPFSNVASRGSLTPPPRVDTPHPSSGIVTSGAGAWLDTVAPIVSPIGRAILAGATDPPEGQAGPSLPMYEEWFGHPAPTTVAEPPEAQEAPRMSVYEEFFGRPSPRTARAAIPEGDDWFAPPDLSVPHPRYLADGTQLTDENGVYLERTMAPMSEAGRRVMENLGMIPREDGTEGNGNYYDSDTTTEGEDEDVVMASVTTRRRLDRDMHWFVEQQAREMVAAEASFLLDNDSEARYYDGPSGGTGWAWSEDETAGNPWDVVPQSEDPW